MSSSNLYSSKRFRKAIQYFLLGRTAQAIAFFALTLWLVRLLAPADYGAYMVLWGMVEMMVPLSSFGMMEAVRRFLPELAARGAPGVLPVFVRWMTLVRLLIIVTWSLIIVFSWSKIAVWIGFDTHQQDVTLVAVGLIITVIGFRYASEMLECLLEQRWSQLTHALMPLGRLAGVAFLVATASMTLEYLLWVDLLVSLVCFLLAEFFLMRKLRHVPETGDFRVGVREIVNFSWHMVGVNVLRAISNAGALRILVARFLGLEVAGMYAFLQQMLMIIGRYLPAKLLLNIIRPMLIARYANGEISVVKHGMSLLWKSNLLIIAVGVAAVCVAGDMLIALASNERFSDAGVIMLIMLLGLGAISQGQLVSMTMQIFLYTRQLRYFSLLCILTPLAVIVGSKWGLIGVVCGIVLSEWLSNNITLLWLNRQVGRIGLDLPGVLRGISLAALLAAIGWAISRELNPWWGLALVIIFYGPGLILMKPLNSFDMELLNRGLHRRARFFAPFAQKSRLSV